jgi:hypothetical protein
VSVPSAISVTPGADSIPVGDTPPPVPTLTARTSSAPMCSGRATALLPPPSRAAVWRAR